MSNFFMNHQVSIGFLLSFAVGSSITFFMPQSLFQYISPFISLNIEEAKIPYEPEK